MKGRSVNQGVPIAFQMHTPRLIGGKRACNEAWVGYNLLFTVLLNS